MKSRCRQAKNNLRIMGSFLGRTFYREGIAKFCMSLFKSGSRSNMWHSFSLVEFRSVTSEFRGGGGVRKKKDRRRNTDFSEPRRSCLTNCVIFSVKRINPFIHSFKHSVWPRILMGGHYELSPPDSALSYLLTVKSKPPSYLASLLFLNVYN